MGRSINIDPLGFQDLSRTGGADSVVIQYDSNKKDKTGKSTPQKQYYVNLIKRIVCMLLALGCYLCLFQDKFDQALDNIFCLSGKIGSAADSYCKCLKEMVSTKQVPAGTGLEEVERKSQDTVIKRCYRLGHFHPRGTRKGAATHVTTNTMKPPSVPWFLLRGDWSIGKVLDIYLRWSQLGNTYVGRLLCRLDPNSEDFSILSPHFREGMENDYIQEAMRCCFGPILHRWDATCSPQGPLLLFLTSMLWYSDFLIIMYADKDRDHPFRDIPYSSTPGSIGRVETASHN